MAQLSRVTQKIFCSTGSQQTAVFGTMKSGSPTYSTNIATLMGNTAWNSGWSGAIIAGKAPFMEEFNAIERVNTQQIAYILQSGIPEWDSGTDYYVGDIVKVVSSGVITVWGATASSTNQNPTSTSGYWAKYFDSTLPYLTQGLVSNCITSIPQDINLELASDGTLTLKAGSVITNPDGTQLTTTADLTTTSTINGKRLVFTKSDGTQLGTSGVTQCVSGSTDLLAGQAYHTWFDTGNTVINYYGSDGSTVSFTRAFPVCEVTISGGQIASIDKVFNGFGYIGHHAFILPGVSILSPEGFNSDGTLKSSKYTTTALLINELLSSGHVAGLSSTNGSIGKRPQYKEVDTLEDVVSLAENGLFYVKDENVSISWAGSGTMYYHYVHFLDYDVYNNVVTKFEPLPVVSMAKQYDLDKKQDKDTALNYGNVSCCVTEIPQNLKIEYTGTTITLKAGSIITKPDGTQLQLSSDSTWTSSLTGTHECILFPRDNGVGAYYQYPSSITSGSTDPKAGETYHIWFDTANKVINRYTSNASTPSQTLALPVCKFTVTSGVITSVDTVFNGFGWCGNALFVLPGVKILIPDGRNQDGTLKSVVVQEQNVRVQNISYSISNGFIRHTVNAVNVESKSGLFEQDTPPTIGANYERWYNTKENKCYYHAAGGTAWVDATGTNYAWSVCGTASKDGVEYTSFNVYDPIRLASTDQVKSLESKVFNEDSSVGGNHTFTGTNTFSGYTLFTNPYGINITAGTCTNTPVAADYSQAIANTMFVQNCISQHEVAPAITILWGDGTAVQSPTNFSLSESFLNFEKIGVEMATDTEDGRYVSIQDTYWFNRMLQTNTNHSIFLADTGYESELYVNSYNHTTNPSTSTDLKVAYEKCVVYYIYGINRKKVP